MLWLGTKQRLPRQTDSHYFMWFEVFIFVGLARNVWIVFTNNLSGGQY